ncbi:tetratricopeptide repeat protein, partial [Frankia sp. EI5c]|uniref:tetratricopeptide repeat protein n=1 Tax=Frankia sp. EI5c TaxID=683316 RepID=UPI001F5B463B
MIGDGPELARHAPALSEVGELGRADAVRLLQLHDSRLTRAEADALAAAVGGLPLALTQAGRLLAATGESAAAYLCRLEEHSRRTEHPAAEHHRCLSAVIETGRAWLAESAPAAAAALDGLAVLAAAPLPAGTLAAAPGLVQLGLVDHGGTEVRVHPLVQVRLRAGLADGRQAVALLAAQQLLVAAGHAATASGHGGTGDGHALGGQGHAGGVLVSLEPHISALAAWIDRLPGPSAAAEIPEFRALTLRVVRHLHAGGGYDSGRELVRRARRRWSGGLGPDHADTLAAAELEAAFLVDGADDLVAARTLLGQVHLHRAETLGADHRDTLRSSWHLARVDGELGDFAESIQLFRDTLECQRARFGAEDPDTLRSAHGLGVVLTRCGEFPEARELLALAHAGRGRRYGLDHVDTRWSAVALGVALRGLGQPAQARELHERVLTGARRQFGDEHPQTRCAVLELALDLVAL